MILCVHEQQVGIGCCTCVYSRGGSGQCIGIVCGVAGQQVIAIAAEAAAEAAVGSIVVNRRS